MPLNAKGLKIMDAMMKQYGAKNFNTAGGSGNNLLEYIQI